MKIRSNICLFLSVIFLTGCSHTFFQARKYANREYVRIGLHELPADEAAVKHYMAPGLTSDKKDELNLLRLKDTVLVTGTPLSLPEQFLAMRKPSIKQSVQTTVRNKRFSFSKMGDIPKATRKANESSALNIIGLAAAILALVGFFAAGIILLFALLSATLLVPGITLMWVCFGLALVGMILGALGVGLKHPGKGMGIAALVIGSIILFSVFLIVILIAVL